MNIAVIGLGLIGGSIAKAIKENTDHIVYGFDKQSSVVMRAKLLEAIDETLTNETMPLCDVVLIALYPGAALEVLEASAPGIKKGALVVDCCGVKEAVCEKAQSIANRHGFHFIGGHPMAGLERSGFDYSKGTLFKNAPMILTPLAGVDIYALEKAKNFFLSIGFAGITIRTPAEHDRVIACTSQLAHVLSNAYVRSETALRHRGLSAGSFRDLTRVATINETMWSELFLLNRENLIAEIDGLVARLNQYGEALRQGDEARLRALLKEGSDQKAMCDREVNP